MVCQLRNVLPRTSRILRRSCQQQRQVHEVAAISFCSTSTRQQQQRRSLCCYSTHASSLYFVEANTRNDSFERLSVKINNVNRAFSALARQPLVMPQQSLLMYNNAAIIINGRMGLHDDHYHHQHRLMISMSTRLFSSTTSNQETETTTGSTPATVGGTAAVGSSKDEQEEEEEDDDEDTTTTSSSSNNKLNVLYRISPLWELKGYYRIEHGFHISNLFQEEWTRFNGFIVWTSQFTCPLSTTIRDKDIGVVGGGDNKDARVYRSGQWRQQQSFVLPAPSLQGVVCENDNSKLKQQERHQPVPKTLVYYRKRNLALQAAAARALDVLRFERDGTLEPRLCEEDPLVFGSEEDANDDSNNSNTLYNSLALLVEDDEEEDDDVVDKEEEEILDLDNDIDDETIEATSSIPFIHVNDQHSGENTHRHPSQLPVPVPFKDDGDIDENDGGQEDGDQVLVFQSDMNKKFVSTIDEQEEGEADDDELNHGDIDESDGGQEDGDQVLVFQSDTNKKFVSTIDELVIHHLPNDYSLSPAERLLQTLTSSQSSLKQGRPSMEIETARKHLWRGVIVDLRSNVKMAMDWVYAANSVGQASVASQYGGIFLPARPGSTSSTLLAAKSVLIALANSNQNVTLSATSNPETSFGVELAATKILDFLWSKKEETHHPDADCYALYLKCLEGPDALSVAVRAEKIVQSMKDGRKTKGRVLPKPNLKIYNALLQLWAQVGGEKGRYSQFDNNDFEPDKESFLAILSSCIYEPSDPREKRIFDAEFARECIQRMTELAEENNDDTLLPDIQVYNAPLRWYCGELWRDSRPYARPVRVDRHRKIFKEGFVPFDENDARVQNAVAVEAWVNEEMNKHDGISPNIESYEAVIQAWVATGTQKGLERAELIAEKLLEDLTTPSTLPRLQSFHPILAGWVHSGAPESPSKIILWIDRLSTAGEVVPSLLPDIRIRVVQIAAQRLIQSRLLAQVEEKGEQLDQYGKDAIMDAARESSRILRQFCDDSMSSNEPEAGAHQVGPLFSQTLFAWRDAALAHASSNTSESFLNEITMIMALFEQVLAHHGANELLDVYHPVNPPGFSDQLRDLCAHAFSVYFSCSRSLREIYGAWRLRNDNSDVLSHVLLPQVERLVRRLSEVQHTMHFDANDEQQSYSALSYFDRYNYGIMNVSSDSSALKSLCLWQVVRLLRESDLSQVNKGDISRLCFLIKGLERSWNSRPRSMCKEVDKILDDILPGLQHRDRIQVFIPKKRTSLGGDENMKAQRQGSRPTRRSSQRNVRRTISRA